ncbi:ribosome assembly cofactor RimP [Hanstruepera marina]|uniref:ribosome assembly cofactor RimP n=1 Tax=Hanstruepera marina TaxID=2873265 RepID=UPI001CA60C45|nr:ribosome assembly cofactor RimP [Hanstruepera marina]
MFRTTVENLLQKALDERKDLFLIDLSVGNDNAIKVILDGDNGVTVDDCVFVSRAIEHNLDREELDFSLEVASAGATEPLSHKRQYVKNIGRDLEVKTSNDVVKGSLVKATDKDITVQWKAREPKPVGKGKVTVQKEANIPIDSIVEAKVMIKF